eukprot:TRINITY_DN1678_c0_g1_i4.p1 TRINITY_DN1678_c0_g1~~TRINITY_DN1678_c0_g1_i4.p1  ORF type:complete len:481 (-),score=104.54 TRINITY_DN1678_c0_g1_i4:97-1506(-)
MNSGVFVLLLVVVVSVGFQRWLSTPFLALSPQCLLLGLQCPHFTLQDVKGYGDEPWATPFRNKIVEFMNEGWTTSMQVSVNFQGQTVVNYAAGYPVTSSVPIDPEKTLMQCWSAAKSVEAIAFLLLKDRNLIEDYNDPIAKYWPEYAQGGKGHVTIADLLRHESATPYTRVPISFDELHDVDLTGEKFASEPNLFGEGNEPGRVYHAATRGLLLSQILRRVDPKKRLIGQFIQEELVQPLSGEFYVGFLGRSVKDGPSADEIVPRWERSYTDYFVRVLSRILLGIRLNAEEQGLFASAANASGIFNRITEIAGLGKPDIITNLQNVRYQEVELTSTNVLSKAKTLADVMALVANGGTSGGRQLISKKIVDLYPSKNIKIAKDEVLGLTAFSESGFALSNFCGESFDEVQGKNLTLGWSGYGGQLLVAIPELQLSFAFVTPLMEINMETTRACIFLSLAKSIAAAKLSQG